MLKPKESSRFRRDLRRMKKRGKDLKKLKKVVRLLVEEQILPNIYRDHSLIGDWSSYRDCHIESDWLLLYRIDQDEKILTLARTGTHSDLFKN